MVCCYEQQGKLRFWKCDDGQGNRIDENSDGQWWYVIYIYICVEIANCTNCILFHDICVWNAKFPWYIQWELFSPGQCGFITGTWNWPLWIFWDLISSNGQWCYVWKLHSSGQWVTLAVLKTGTWLSWVRGIHTTDRPKLFFCLNFHIN